ncbi:MAG TPA: TMEM175 family protein [Solirubrobacterales bacterium]|nr:TMEM175 family protein [Solirubrobacterales bacterium]
MAESVPDVHDRDEAEIEFGRIVAFSDGVFTIAITLLVLSLEVPPGGDLSELLSERAEQFFAYFLSFAVTARFWLAHHRFYGLVQRFDRRLVTLNFVYLSFVALLPFTTELIGDYSDDPLGVAIYAGCLAILSLAFLSQTYHAYGAGLVREDALPYRRRFTGPPSWIGVIIFGGSIPLALISPTLAVLTWLLMFVAGRWVRDRASGLSAPG